MSHTGRVAIFDLDETLTHHDTFLPFLFGYLKRYPWRFWVLLSLPVRLLAFWRWGERTWVKRCFLFTFLGGQPRRRLQLWADDYAQLVAREGMRPATLEQLHAHQSAGDRVVLATASFDVYVEPLAHLLGIEAVVSSRVAWDAKGRLCGMRGENCRDQEKLLQVQTLLGEGADPGMMIAYSDSHADLPLLTWVGEGVAVSPTTLLAARVDELGLRAEYW